MTHNLKGQALRRLRRRAFSFGKKDAPLVRLAQLSTDWTPLDGVAGIVGCSIELPEDVGVSICAFRHFKDGDRFPAHVHEETETIFVVSGAYYIEVEGDGRAYYAGESIMIGPLMEHKGYPIEDTILICTFSPPLIRIPVRDDDDDDPLPYRLDRPDHMDSYLNEDH